MVILHIWQWALTRPFTIRLAFCVWVFVVWSALCLMPQSGTSSIDLINDKLAHAIANCGLVVALILVRQGASYVHAGLWVGLHSVAIEVIQYYIPSRFFSTGDIAANIVGVVIAVTLVSLFKHQLECQNGTV